MNLLCRTLLLAALTPLAADAATVNFDGLAAGTAISTVGEVTFASPQNPNLVVSTGLETTSAANYLGSADTFGESFVGGDSLSLTFAQPLTDLSLTVLSTPGSSAGAYVLSSGGESDASSFDVGKRAVLPQFGDDAFFLAISLPAGFTSALLASSGSLLAFNVDDVSFTTATIPIPPSSVLMVPALAWLCVRARRR